MKEKTLALLLVATLLLGVSCSSRNDSIVETQWKVINISVNGADWRWNENDESYSVAIDLPELTQYIFDNGGAIGYFKWGNNRKTPLPFSNAEYFDVADNTGLVHKTPITENISCDFQLGSPSVVVFTRQLSDRSKPNSVPNTNFQVVLFW